MPLVKYCSGSFYFVTPDVNVIDTLLVRAQPFFLLHRSPDLSKASNNKATLTTITNDHHHPDP